MSLSSYLRLCYAFYWVFEKNQSNAGGSATILPVKKRLLVLDILLKLSCITCDLTNCFSVSITFHPQNIPLSASTLFSSINLAWPFSERRDNYDRLPVFSLLKNQALNFKVDMNRSCEDAQCWCSCEDRCFCQRKDYPLRLLPVEWCSGSQQSFCCSWKCLQRFLGEKSQSKRVYTGAWKEDSIFQRTTLRHRFRTCLFL